MSRAYSFAEVYCSLFGPGCNIQLGSGAGNADEGITIEFDGNRNTMTKGADKRVMHSLHANQSGKLTVRLMKTSPVNQLLSAAFNYQAGSAANWGQNVITLTNGLGDNFVCTDVAFEKFPNQANGTEGAFQEWAFDAGFIDPLLGNGTPINPT